MSSSLWRICSLTESGVGVGAGVGAALVRLPFVPFVPFVPLLSCAVALA